MLARILLKSLVRSIEYPFKTLAAGITLIVMLASCGGPSSLYEPACPNVHPFTPKQHWCDPNYNK
jgi:hypothetical protein